MPDRSFELKGKILNGMQIVSAGHVDVEEIVLDPDRGVCCAIIRFNIDVFKPFWDLMIHYLICEAQWVCGASVLGDIATELKRALFVVFGPAGLTVSGVTVIVTYRGAPA